MVSCPVGGLLIQRIIFYALAFLSGAVALSHELLWTRRLIDLLGATEAVTGRVLGLFFLGLSLGGWLASRWSRSSGNFCVRLGIAELSIALLSLPAIFLPYWADGLISMLGIEGLIAWQGTVAKLAITSAVVLPPAIAMGTTMPMFIQIISDLGATLKRGGVWIYSINMIGGVFGLWFVSTCLLEIAGVQGTMLCAALGNVLISLAAFAFRTQVAHKAATTMANSDELAVDAESSGKNWNMATVFCMSFASGAVVLASEVLILRLLNLVAPSSLQTTSALLANVIFFLALGSIAVAVLNHFKVGNRYQLIFGGMGAALFCVLCPLILYETTDELISLRYLAARNGDVIGSLNRYWSFLFGIIALSSGAAMFFYGLVFPAIMSVHSSLDPRGRLVGLLLAVNGVGGLVGAEVANLFLVSQLGIYQGFVIISTVTVLVVLAVCIIEKQKWIAGATVLGVALVAISCFSFYQNLKYLSPNTTQKYSILDTRFGREGVLMVVEAENKSRSLVMNNQYKLGSSGEVLTERRQLLLPWLLHPEADSVCCIGFATGISASGLEQVKSPPNITAVELSASVAKVAKEYFAEQNGGFINRPGNRLVIEDGRTFIACADRDFDLIVADLFRPFGVGESRLFSIEHFRNAKRALREDGLFVQWLPAHQLSRLQFETIANTYQNVFPNVLVVLGNRSSRTPIVGLCGWKNDQPWEADDLFEKIQAYRTAHSGALDPVVINPQWLIIGTLKKDVYSSATINTLDNAFLEIEAGRFWITKDLRPNRPQDNFENGFLSNRRWLDFVVELFKDSDSVFPDPRNRKELLVELVKAYKMENPSKEKSKTQREQKPVSSPSK